jgi:hypothetical protein
MAGDVVHGRDELWLECPDGIARLGDGALLCRDLLFLGFDPRGEQLCIELGEFGDAAQLTVERVPSHAEHYGGKSQFAVERSVCGGVPFLAGFEPGMDLTLRGRHQRREGFQEVSMAVVLLLNPCRECPDQPATALLIRDETI